MPKIVIKNLDNKVITTNETAATVLSLLHNNFIDWMHACGGKGRCTTCKMIVLEGMENLAGPTRHEERFRDIGALKENERLTCQAILRQEQLVIRVPESSKLPHMSYSD